MKHIFFIHSPITYLVSVSVINELQISPEDAIIIFHGFDNKTLLDINRYTGVSMNNFNSNKNWVVRVYNYFRYFNIINRLDKVIDSATKGKKFIAYVPGLSPVHRSLVTHPNCVSFNFIEEGLAQYYTEETLESLNPTYSKYSWRSSVLKNTKRVMHEIYLLLRGYNFKLQGLPFSYSCYHAFSNVLCYGLSKDSFSLIDEKKRHIVSFKKENFGLIKQEFDINLSDKIVWIGDSGILNYGFSNALYLKGIKEGCIEFVKNRDVNNIYIKFHREEPANIRQAINKLFRDNNISVEIIPDSVIMELLLFEAKNVTLIGVYSSLLYYASLMGHHSFSIYNFLKEEYSVALKNRDFTFYWNKVALIKPQFPHKF